MVCVCSAALIISVVSMMVLWITSHESWAKEVFLIKGDINVSVRLSRTRYRLLMVHFTYSSELWVQNCDMLIH